MLHKVTKLASIVAAVTVSCSAGSVPYKEYILAPSSRTVVPSIVHQVNGSVTNAISLTEGNNGTATFNGSSTVTYDFGKNIAGVISVVAGNSSSSDAKIWLTYTESSVWINGNASDATSDAGLDEPLALDVGNGPGTYSVDRDHERGGFRYLSLVSNSTGTIEISSVTVDFTAAPLQDDLRAYTGYFHCNDELLNRIWYAGAYTNQLCTIDPRHGNALVFAGVINSTENISLPQTDPWYYNYTITNATSGKWSATVDGAKRDKLVWPGDLAISFPSIVVSTNDLITVQNSLESLLVLQEANGRFPYAGIPFAYINITSFTYHLYNLQAIANYYKYTGDLSWLAAHWAQYKAGLAWSLSYIDSTKLMNVTSPPDWLRVGMGGHNIEANAILYYTLNQAISLAPIVNDTSLLSNWTSTAAGVKSAANDLLWDESAGLYRDNETTTLYPQDGNVWAILSNLTTSTNQSTSISSALRARWGAYGAPAPEGGETLTISPFIGSFELEAHYLASTPQNAIDLMRLEWGFMLNDPRMTNSTLIEGYSADGSLHYAPYRNDPRVSHAHGWSTGPTSLLTFYAAGIQLIGERGSTWKIAPQLGDLTEVEAGFKTGLGEFSCKVKLAGADAVSLFEFVTPRGTSGSVDLPGAKGILLSKAGGGVKLVDGKAENVPGGEWWLEVQFC